MRYGYYGSPDDYSYRFMRRTAATSGTIKSTDTTASGIPFIVATPTITLKTTSGSSDFAAAYSAAYKKYIIPKTPIVFVSEPTSAPIPTPSVSLFFANARYVAYAVIAIKIRGNTDTSGLINANDKSVGADKF